MIDKTQPLLGALLLAGAALAQGSAPAGKVVGKVAKVQGLVTVSIGTTVGSAAVNAPLLDGSRFVTGSTGSVDLVFNDDCKVELAPNQSLVVDAAKACDDRKAVVWLERGAPLLLLGGGGLQPLVGLGVVAGIALIDGDGGRPASGTGGGGGGIPDPPPSGQ